MKVFAATKETQGKRGNDFCYVPEDELVVFPIFECYGELIDGACGCKRAMTGLETGKSTTTFKVVEVDFSKEEFEKMILDFYVKSGLKKGNTETKTILKLKKCDSIEKYAKLTAYEITALARNCVPGAILERREQITFRL